MKQRLMPLIKLLVAGGLIFWLIQSGRFDLNALKKINTVFIWAFGIVTFLVVLLVNVKRWQLLLRIENVQISFGHCFNLSLIGIFFNFFMPGGVGGDVIKAGYLMRDYRDKKWFIGYSILLDRVLGMFALLLFSALSGLTFYKQLGAELQLSIYTISLLTLVGMFALVTLMILLPKERVDRLLRSHPSAEKFLLPLYFFFHRPKNMILPFLLSLISQGLVIGLGVFLALFLHVDIPAWVVLLVFPFGFLATVIPISPAGIGVGQAAFYYLFQEVSGDGEFGVLSITFFQAVQFLVGLFGGLLFVMYKKEEA